MDVAIAPIRGVSIGLEWVEDDDYHYWALDILIVRFLFVFNKE